jgi:hypothetical protein
MSKPCPDCGTPLDEIPLSDCGYHRAHDAIEAATEKRLRAQIKALKAKLDARPIWQKMREADTCEEAINHLADYLEAKSQS